VLRGVAMIRVVLVDRNVVLMDVAMSVCIQLEVLSHHLVCIVLIMVMFVSDLQQLGGFLLVLRFSPSIKQI